MEQMNNFAELALATAKNLQSEVSLDKVPPAEGTKPRSEKIIPFSYVKNTRGYIEKVVNQINGCYSDGYFDGCAVMIRRLIETLIVESFEKHSIASKIQNSNGDFYQLKDLIDKTVNEVSWNLSRNSKDGLKKFKKIGDLSAHSRRYNAHRSDIDDLITDLRVVVQELVSLADLYKKNP